MNELKLCPFCGSDDVDCLELGSGEHKQVNLYCAGCQAMGPTKRNREDASKAWNTRIGSITPFNSKRRGK